VVEESVPLKSILVYINPVKPRSLKAYL
jgi:hypothetical protein